MMATTFRRARATRRAKPEKRYGSIGGKARFVMFVQSAPTAPTMSHPSPEATASESRRLRILLVEDEASVRTIITAYLAERHQVETASSGAEGLRRFQTGVWDVVLCNGKLGDMNGVELATALKAISPGTPIILVTGSAYSLPKEAEDTSLFAGRLDKPFGRENLQAAIAAACSH